MSQRRSHQRGSPNHPTLWPCAGCDKVNGTKGKKGVQCDICDKWWHLSCTTISSTVAASQSAWTCPKCRRASSHRLDNNPASGDSSPSISQAVGQEIHAIRLGTRPPDANSTPNVSGVASSNTVAPPTRIPTPRQPTSPRLEPDNQRSQESRAAPSRSALPRPPEGPHQFVLAQTRTNVQSSTTRPTHLPIWVERRRIRRQFR